MLSLLLAVPAWADSTAPTSRGDKERAAKKACAVGDVKTGIDLLAELYVETNDATYIHNQGRCYQQNDQPERGISRFQEYLRKTPDIAAKDKALVQNHIADCEAQIAKKAPPTADTQQGKVIYLPPMPTPGTAVPATPPSPADSPGRGLRITGIVAGIVGVAALGAGVTFNLMERDLSDRIRNVESKDTENNRLIRGNYETAAKIFYFAGGASMAAGLAFYFIGYAMEPSKKVALLPGVGPGQAGLWLRGAF